MKVLRPEDLGAALGAAWFLSEISTTAQLNHPQGPEAAATEARVLMAQFGRHPWIVMGLAWANGAAGRREKADALYAELAARARSEYVQPAALDGGSRRRSPSFGCHTAFGASRGNSRPVAVPDGASLAWILRRAPVRP